MISRHSIDVAARAKAIYSQRLQAELEAGYRDSYVAIEPDSGDHFVAASFGEAPVAAAHDSIPGSYFLCDPRRPPSGDPFGRIGCYIEWFGEIRRVQVIGNNGKLPLLGTELLAKRKLLIDYEAGVVSIS